MYCAEEVCFRGGLLPGGSAARGVPGPGGDDWSHGRCLVLGGAGKCLVLGVLLFGVPSPGGLLRVVPASGPGGGSVSQHAMGQTPL